MERLTVLWDELKCWQLAAGKGRGRRKGRGEKCEVRRLILKSQVIKHSDVTYCIVMSCVGGEVTSPYGIIGTGTRELSWRSSPLFQIR